MATTITIDPVTRLEGHLEVEVTVDLVGGTEQVVDAHSTGTMFRGIEMILMGRDPRDATHITQRICGVCPICHGTASCLTLEDAFGVTPPPNGRILRNLINGANYVMSHVLHFYHLAALDYINTTGILEVGPWSPRYVTPDMATGATAQALVGNYVAALAIRRKAHQMAAIFGGKLPCSPALVPGGCTAQVTTEAVDGFRTLLTELRTFINGTYVPDVLAVASLFPSYYSIGVGCQNLLSYGVFDLDETQTNKLLARGRYTGGASDSVDPAQIKEYVAYSKYTPASGNVNPAVGVTEPDAAKPGAYSWVKAPRYLDTVHEVGPLARMWVNGDYTNGISVLDRHAARALECQKVADAMDGWLTELVPGDPTYTYAATPVAGTGIGLTEAPRGALGHWTEIAASQIARYQAVVPTTWNASPRDDMGQMGPIEQALMDTPVADPAQPVEVLRVIHSYDPCLACAIHMVRPAIGTRKKVPITTAQVVSGI